MTQTVGSRRVTVTGANGAIGRPVVRELQSRGYVVTGVDLVEPELADVRLVGSVTDLGLMRRALAGADAVVHLAAEPNDCDFVSRLVPSNVIGPYNVLEAAREAGVSRVVLASSAQAASGVKGIRERKVTVEDGSAPTNHYGLTKVLMEEMGRMYARKFQMSVVSVRVGWMVRNSREAELGRSTRHLPGMYISARDSGRLFAACVESAFPGRGQEITVYGTSKPCGADGLDVTSAIEKLGYEPLDMYPEGMPE